MRRIENKILITFLILSVMLTLFLPTAFGEAGGDNASPEAALKGPADLSPVHEGVSAGNEKEESFPKEGGIYEIQIKAMQQDGDTESMAGRYLLKTATLEASGGKIYVYFTTIRNDWLCDMKHKDGTGGYVPVEIASVNGELSSTTYKLEISNVDDALYVSVFVLPMGDALYLRLVFDKATLTEITGTAPEEPEEPDILSDGEYTVDADALMENSDDPSMTGQFITEPAILKVADGQITASMVWHGTDFITMDMLEELKYKNAVGDFVDVTKVLDSVNNTLEITFPVAGIGEPVIMQVYVPAGMGESRPRFRLVLKEDTLKKTDANTPVIPTPTPAPGNATPTSVNATPTPVNTTPPPHSQTTALADGQYSIDASALMEYSDDPSMADQFFAEPVTLNVSGGNITASTVWRGTSVVPMEWIEELEYKNSGGSWVDTGRVLNPGGNTLKVTFNVEDINKPVYMRVSVPKGMPGTRPIFRVIFNVSSLRKVAYDPGSPQIPGAAAVSYVIGASAASQGGVISPSGSIRVTEGDDQIFTITPDKGYKIKYVLVNGGSVGAVNTYTFHAVRADAEIRAAFEKTEALEETDNSGDAGAPEDAGENTAAGFTDISGHWAKEAIRFVTGRGMFKGTGQNTFSPDLFMTRGMFVTVLGRACGADTAGYAASGFKDVAAGKYYTPYIAWAAEKNIVKGVGDGRFEPDKEITREQMAVIFANYAGFAGAELPDVSDTVQDGALEDGRYSIGASALQEKNDSDSMTGSFLTEPAVLTVKDGKITASMVWHGTQYITMDMIEELKLQNSSGKFLDIDRVFDKGKNTLSITFGVEDINKASVMQVYVPKGMGETRPKFRLVFDVKSLKRLEAAFKDEEKISSWARESVERIRTAGIIQGRDNNMFDPKGMATRAEVAAILARGAGYGK